MLHNANVDNNDRMLKNKPVLYFFTGEGPILLKTAGFCYE